jgi:hypothetical protein
MSGPRYSVVPAAAIDDERVSNMSLRVLLIIGTHTDNNGWCQVNQRKIADRMGVRRETVNRCIGCLVECGYLRKVDTRCQGRPGGTCKYQTLLDRPDVDEVCAKPYKGSPPPCDAGRTGVVLSDAQGVVRSRRSQHNVPINNDTTDEKGASADSSFEVADFDWGEEDRQASPLETPKNDNAKSDGEQVCKVTDETDLQIMLDQLKKTVGTGKIGKRVADGQFVLCGWLEAGADFEKDILPAVRLMAARKKRGKINSWYYFSGAIIDAMSLRKAGLPMVSERARTRIEKSRTGALKGGGLQQALAQQSTVDIDMSKPFGVRS